MESVAKGLDMGGVTYLKKLFEIDELLAYIRRYAWPLPAERGIPFGSFRLVPDSHLLLYKGKPFKKLACLEYNLLELLLVCQGEIVDRGSIILHLWGEGYSSTATQSLNNLISHLRKYLSLDKSIRLETHARVGYSLTADSWQRIFRYSAAGLPCLQITSFIFPLNPFRQFPIRHRGKIRVS